MNGDASAAILALALVVAGFVPALGGIVYLCVWLLGLGAYILYVWRTRDEPFVPELGGIVYLCVWLLGLGAFILYAWRTRHEPFVPATTQPTVASSPAA